MYVYIKMNGELKSVNILYMKKTKKKKVKKMHTKKHSLKMTLFKKFNKNGTLKGLRDVINTDELSKIEADEIDINIIKKYNKHLNILLKASNKKELKQTKNALKETGGAQIGYIEAIFCNRNEADLKRVFERKKIGDEYQSWASYPKYIKHRAENCGIKMLYNAFFYNHLDCILHLLSTSENQMGGALLAKSNLQILPEMEEDDALDFTMDILHKSYVDENFHKNLETHGIEKIGAFVSTIKMNNKKYNGIELLGKSVGEEQRLSVFIVH